MGEDPVKESCNQEAKEPKPLAIQQGEITVVVLPALLIRQGSCQYRNITVKCLPEQLTTLKIFQIYFHLN